MKTERNKELSSKVLSGARISDTAKEYGISHTTARFIVLRNCKNANPELYSAGIRKGEKNNYLTPPLKYLVKNKHRFLLPAVPMKNFAIIGAAGFVAPRHMQAIKDVGGNLVAAIDPHDSVGILDSFFPDCKFFTEFERFDRYCTKSTIDYAVVLSPNYLHEPHTRWALRNGMDVICEKPIALTERNVDAVAETEKVTGHKVWCILQSRLHEEIKKIPEHFGKNYVVVNYCAPRGDWFQASWKSNESKSGGLATNLGIHLFDLMVFLFGDIEMVTVINRTMTEINGTLQMERAFVKWRISIDKNEKQQRTFLINDHKLDLSAGFKDLHTTAYRAILEGKGFGIEDARQAIRIVERIRCQ